MGAGLCHVTFDFVYHHSPPSASESSRYLDRPVPRRRLQTGGRAQLELGEEKGAVGRFSHDVGPFIPTTEQCQALPHNCSMCVLALSLRGRHFANGRVFLFFECNWVFQLGPTCDSGIRSNHPGNWSFWFLVLRS